MSHLLRAAFVWSVLANVATAMAQEPSDQRTQRLYQVDQYVADQGEQTRRQAAQRSLLRVISRVSGLVSVPRNASIAQALRNPERYYAKYVYFDPKGAGANGLNRIDNARESDATELAVRFTFQPAMIKQLARSAKLPTWWSRRPLTLVWMVLDEPDGRSVVDQGAVSIRGALDYAAHQRGLPGLLPSMDLDDSLLVSTGVVWGKFTEVLDQASDRYDAGQYLVGRFSVQEILGERFFTGEWLVRLEGGDISRFVQGVGIDMAAQGVLDQHVVFADSPRQHYLVVSGIDDIGAYSSLLDYLQSLEFVDDVMLLSMYQNTLKLRVNTAATDEQLRNLLIDDGRFERAPEATDIEPEALIKAPEFVWRERS
jgi:hypothetical protein